MTAVRCVNLSESVSFVNEANDLPMRVAVGTGKDLAGVCRPNWIEKVFSEHSWGGGLWSGPKTDKKVQLVALFSQWQQDGACSPAVGRVRAPVGCVEFGSLR